MVNIIPSEQWTLKKKDPAREVGASEGGTRSCNLMTLTHECQTSGEMDPAGAGIDGAKYLTTCHTGNNLSHLDIFGMYEGVLPQVVH